MDAGKRILIVEDDTVISDIIAYNLNKEGFRSLTAADGETGLSLARSEEPDLILLDVMLPGVNGFEVCRRVRETSAVPIIMLTAREGEDDKVEGLELGADDYITKPFQMRELISRVRANLRRSSGELVTGAQQGEPRSAASRWKSAPASLSCCAFSPPRPTPCSRARKSSAASTAMNMTAARASSTSPCGGCAKSSKNAPPARGAMSRRATASDITTIRPPPTGRNGAGRRQPR